MALAGCRSDGDARPAATGASGIDWSRLRRAVQGRLALPADASYAQVRLTQNPRYDGQRPLAVLSVASAQDVATAFRFAQDHDVSIAIRSGGHSYPGWSGGGSPRALVIDVRPLHGVRLDGTKAMIGSGAALAHVYDAVSARGRGIAAGSCPTVGIAGLTVGGGVGVLTRAYGLTCDFVTAMQVVTAEGRVIVVDAHHEPDLFWALRGGGGNFGIVTAIELELYPVAAV